MFQSHFFVEIGQGGFGSPGVLAATVHEEAQTDAAKYAQDPRGVAMPNAVAILIGADIQPLVQSGFDAPVGALSLRERGVRQPRLARSQVKKR